MNFNDKRLWEIVKESSIKVNNISPQRSLSYVLSYGIYEIANLMLEDIETEQEDKCKHAWEALDGGSQRCIRCKSILLSRLK